MTCEKTFELENNLRKHALEKHFFTNIFDIINYIFFIQILTGKTINGHDCGCKNDILFQKTLRFFMIFLVCSYLLKTICSQKVSVKRHQVSYF